jgi:hypothetical protein
VSVTAIVALAGIAFRLALLVAAIWFTVETSKRDPILTKFGKFVGLVISAVPIVGLIMFVVFRRRPSGYGERCGVMAILGVILYVVFIRG